METEETKGLIQSHPVCKGGRPAKFSAESLWEKALQYFDWVEENPLYKSKVFANGKVIKVPKMRPMTETGFSLFAGISHRTFRNYKTSDRSKKCWKVAENISMIIYVQKFEGAAANLFNANIISRDLGLTVKLEVQVKERLNFDHLQVNEIDRLIDILKD